MSENKNNSKLSVTERAYALLQDENAILNDFSNAQSILTYLTACDDNFPSVGMLIKLAMIDKGLCPETAPNKEFIKVLQTRMSAQNDEIMQMYKLRGDEEYEKICEPLLGKVRPLINKTIERWIDEDDFTRNRSSCIRICFALDLDLKQSFDFMNKFGYQPLSLRSAQDAVINYCILTQRPLGEAIRIYGEYLKEINKNSGETKADKVAPYYLEGSGTTGRMESDLLSGSTWESEKDFIHTFLLPNSKSFISFSKTALIEYVNVKNPLMLTILDEQVSLEEVKESDDAKFSKKLFKTFKKISNKDEALPFLKDLSKEASYNMIQDENGYRHFSNNLIQICEKLGSYIKENRNNPNIQKEINVFLSEIIKGDDFFNSILDATIDDKTAKKRAFGTSDLADTVFFKFPHRQSFTDYEKNPANESLYVTMRKAIILMYYYAFVYDFIGNGDEESFFSGFFEEMTIEGFIETLNSVLLRCRYAPLYPGNRFDWLILVSIRKTELTDYKDVEKALSYVNEVLKVSIPPTE